MEASKGLTKLKHFVYASSSSVYGGSKNLPFSESENVSRPVSLYAATKACNELMAFTYSHLHGIPLTGVRLFTVYGPWEDLIWLHSDSYGRFWRPKRLKFLIMEI